MNNPNSYLFYILPTILAGSFGIIGIIFGSLLTRWRLEWSERREFKKRFLERQLRYLYGPLYYFVMQSENLFELYDKYHKAYKTEYVNKKYSKQVSTQAQLKKDANATLDIANRCIDEVKNNNLKIKHILDNNAPLIDPDDIELFSLFFTDIIRLDIEHNEEGKQILPYEIYTHIGEISFLNPKVSKHIKNKFMNKKKQLDKLLKL